MKHHKIYQQYCAKYWMQVGIPLDIILIEYILEYDSECIGKYFDVILNILRYNLEYIGKYWDLILNKLENIGI